MSIGTFAKFALLAAIIAVAYTAFSRPAQNNSLSVSSFEMKGNAIHATFVNHFPEPVFLASFEINGGGRLVKVGVPSDYPALAQGEAREVEFTMMHGCTSGQNYSAEIMAEYALSSRDAGKKSANFSLEGPCS